MVEKIDRPEAPPPYQITRAKDAHEDQHQSPNQREEQEKRYQEQLKEKAWKKFDKRTMVIKPLLVAKEKIQRCLFRAVILHSGVGTLQLDVVWKDGKTTIGALVLLASVEQFFQLKKYSPGQEVPEEYWARGATVELGIIQVLSSGAGFTPRPDDKEEKAKEKTSVSRKRLSSAGLTDASGKLNWGIIILYVFLTAMIATVIVMAIK